MSTPRQPTTHTLSIEGITLAYHEWAASGDGRDGGAPIVIAHATGFHGRCYAAIAERFADTSTIALDLRGHGMSGGGPIDHWQVMARDVIAVLDAIGIEGAIGVGHSMGGHALVEAAARAPHLLSRLVLFDPVIMPPAYYDLAGAGEAAPHPAIRRKRHFVSVAQMMDRFATREPYSLFDPRVFADYCQFGLIEQPDGTFVLACSPEMEASVYGSARSNAAILDAARKVEVPALVVRARRGETMDFTSSPTWPGLAATMPKGEDHPRPDRTHFHPFEDPGDAAAIIAGFATR